MENPDVTPNLLFRKVSTSLSPNITVCRDVQTVTSNIRSGPFVRITGHSTIVYSLMTLLWSISPRPGDVPRFFSSHSLGPLPLLYPGFSHRRFLNPRNLRTLLSDKRTSAFVLSVPPNSVLSSQLLTGLKASRSFRCLKSEVRWPSARPDIIQLRVKNHSPGKPWDTPPLSDPSVCLDLGLGRYVERLYTGTQSLP